MDIEDTNSTVVSLYVVKNSTGAYFAGYDSAKKQATTVSNPLKAKKFTNKYDIKLRPDESVVELTFDLAKTEVALSEPFRPQRRVRHA